MGAEGFNYKRINANIQQLGYPGVNAELILPPSLNFDKIPNKTIIVPFIEDNLPKVVEMINTAKPYSFQEYLGYAMVWGMRALSQGTYGIGALYILNHEGQEWLIAGRNGLATDMDTSKHAEMDAIDAVESIARGEDTYKDRVILRRKARDNDDRKMIMTSLDPCPMCRVRIHNHNIPLVGVGNEDTFAGSMVRANADMMPPLWKVIMEAQGTQVTLANDDPKSLAYIDAQYLPIVKQMFELNRDAIDKALKEGTLSNVSDIKTIALGLMRMFGGRTTKDEVIFDRGIRAIRSAKSISL